jgi:hypothetical protein
VDAAGGIGRGGKNISNKFLKKSANELFAILSLLIDLTSQI